MTITRPDPAACERSSADRIRKLETPPIAGIIGRIRYERARNRAEEDAKSMASTLQKQIRVTAEQWQRIEEAARDRKVSPNQLVVDLAIETLERPEWPVTEAEIYLLRSAMFAAQAIALDMQKAGRKDEIEKISRTISKIAPELP